LNQYIILSNKELTSNIYVISQGQNDLQQWNVNKS
jgi:hypothetical protein